MYPMVYSGHVLYPKPALFLWIYGTLNKMNEWIYKKCTRFLASAAMYMRSALLYSTLRNITVESQISETYIFLNYIMVVRDCDFLWESHNINFEKMYGRSTRKRWRMYCSDTRVGEWKLAGPIRRSILTFYIITFNFNS